jgi:hypothetical protein
MSGQAIELLVGRFVEERIGSVRIGLSFSLKNQACALRIAVDERRIVDDRLIDLDDFSVKRTIDVRGRLDGLDGRGSAALGEARHPLPAVPRRQGRRAGGSVHAP